MRIALTSLAFSLILLTGCDKEKVVNENEMPGGAREYVETHFPTANVQQVVKERDDLEVTYDVILDNQVKLTFDKNGDCYDAESPLSLKLPDSVVPANVLEYVKANYADHFIVEWEKNKTDQEVKLSNRVELKFNLSGGFLRIDD
ncbi:MAG TPA: PepSY-like domain-containing protein [Dyadobacter sp.]|jgi:hypothetical protein|nr:PepSY-like domain-containing protein [Dyadobacter sp.]